MPLTPRNRAERPAGERGSALVEFVLCFGLFWIPLFFGTAVFGFDLIRAIQVTQLCRDAGHMYAFGTDFSQTGGQALLGTIAIGMDLSSSGNAKVILSTVTFIADSDCQAGGLQPNSSSCPNYGKYVFTRRVLVPASGGTTFASAFGTPAGIMNSSGGIALSDYLRNPSARVTVDFAGTTGITLVSGQVSYLSEVYAQPLRPITWNSFTNPGATARSIF